MISRYSVKRPYTVIVAIVMVIILGFVSFGKMTADLLPSMNLPYVIVMTTYMGASPDEVEEIVTKPIEQSMATVSNIKNVSSTSAESMSMVMLEFAETTNMDSVTIEIREKLDQISSYWEDTVGNPTIMKLNPDMMPIMVASVDMDGLDSVELTNLVSKKIAPDIESIEGVASVSETGSVTESIQVIINQSKIDKMNEKVMAALDTKFIEAEEKISNSKEELSSGKDQLQSGKEEMASQMTENEQQLNDSKLQMIQGEAEINAQLKALDEKEQELLTNESTIASKEQTLKAGEKELKSTESSLNNAKSNLELANSTLKTLLESEQDLKTAIENAEEEETEELQANLENVQTKLTAIRAGLESQGISEEDIPEKLAEIKAGLKEITAKKTELSVGKNEIAAAKAGIEKGKASIAAGREALQQAKQDILSGKSTIEEAALELSKQKTLASIEMSVKESQIGQGEKELEKAEEALNDSKKTAYEETSLKNIITADMVKGILTAENFTMPAGYVTEAGTDYMIRVGNKVDNVADLQNLIILDLGMEGLNPIKLSEVADVAVTNDSSEVYAKINGNPGVMLTIEKQTGYSTGDVSKKIKAKFESLKTEYEGIHMTALMDQGIYIDMVVNSVLQNMLYGGLLAILILLFFLKDIKPTFVIACSIPISIVTALVLMYFSGVTINIISLSGLALGVGMLVDNSIVVIENIYRMRNEGVPVKEAAIEGAKQVAGAIAASTLTTVCVFAPIVFTDGIARTLFVDMGLTIAFSLLASLVIALTFVPMMSSGVLRNTKEKAHPIFSRVQDFYSHVLEGALKWKPLVLLLVVALLGASGYFAIKAGTSFMPKMESTQISIDLKTADGSTLTETGEIADQVMARILEIPDVETVGAMAGASSMSSMMGSSGNSEPNKVTMYVLLKEDKELSGAELKKRILEDTATIPCELEVNTETMDTSSLGASGISIQIKGKDLDQLSAIAKNLTSITAGVEGTKNATYSTKDASAELRVVVDKTKAMQHKLTVAQVFQEINKRLKEASTVTKISTDTKDYNVFVLDNKDSLLTRNIIKDMTIPVTNADGEKEELPLKEIAQFVNAEGPTSISRDAQSRYTTVTAELEDGYNIGLVSAAVQKEIDKAEIPEGYQVTMKGEDETINDAMGQLLLMLVLAVAFMYLIMVAQFQSLLSPFIIMFTIPLAFTGGFLGLIITRMEISVIAMVGFIMLSGIIVNNGIVLVDYTNQLRRGGMDKKEAIIEAGATRLRPILMTAITTILGLSTMAFGMGMGADMVQPMAVVTIGGLIYGTLLTLFVVPCIYDLLHRNKSMQEEIEEI